MTINLNDEIEIRLKPKGREILRVWWSVNPGRPVEAVLLTVYPRWHEGVVRIPIWQFAQIFGPHISMGFDPPVETTVELLGYQVEARGQK